jgi:polar amino acid transport system substrate-binding protein
MRRLLAPVATALALGLSACGVDSGTATDRALPPLTSGSTTTSTTAAPTGPVQCSAPSSSYAPLSPLPRANDAIAADAVMKKIFDRGHLVVAVDENTKYLAARNTTTGHLEGAEIEIAKSIARHIFGSADDDTIQFKTVTTKEKLAFPEHDDVDISISAISITCERWERVAFSTVYLTAVPRFLVRKQSRIENRDELAGKRVCVTQGSTSIDLMASINEDFEDRGKQPAVVVAVPMRTDCLLELQEGMVDAYLGHDTFMTGMLEQNPGLIGFETGSPEQQDYGIAINQDHTYFVQFVNGVLQEMRDDGSLQALMQHYVKKSIPPVPPTRALP